MRPQVNDNQNTSVIRDVAEFILKWKEQTIIILQLYLFLIWKFNLRKRFIYCIET